MNNLSINEKKSLFVLIVVSVLCLLEYTLFNLKVISSNIENFSTVLILGLLAVYIFIQPRANPKASKRLVGYYMVWMLACGVIYLFIYFGCGFLFGFGNNPYNRSTLGIISNILFFGGIIALKEWIRSFVINKVDKKLVFIYGAVLVLLYTVIEVDIVNLFRAETVEGFVIELSQKILPVLVLNIFLSYICYIAGHLPAVVYMLVTSIPIWFFDNLPNLEWIVVGVIGIAFPVFAIIALSETAKIKRQGNRQRKNGTPKTINAVLWIFVGTFCIVAAFFTAGLFNVFPTVLVSGSMQPSINRGDVVIIEKLDEGTEIYVDDVILFNAGDFDVVHRVVEIYSEDGKTKYITKGDDNQNRDNVSIETINISGKVVARIPYIGLPRLLITSTEHEETINN